MTASTTEEALVWMLELFNMSADVLRFDKLLSAQMVASIDRLQQLDSQAFGNLRAGANSDFYELYRFKRAVRDDSVSAKMLTGYDLCADSLCRLLRLLKTSEGKVQVAQAHISHVSNCLRVKEGELLAAQARETEARRSESSRMNAARLVLAFKHIGDIPDATAAKLLQALRFRAVSVDELVKTRFGGGAHERQEVLVHEAHPEPVRILQRVPPGPEPPAPPEYSSPQRGAAPSGGECRPCGAAAVEVTVAT